MTIDQRAIDAAFRRYKVPTYRQRLYRMRHFELLAELYLFDPNGIWSRVPGVDTIDYRACMSRDKLICAVLEWQELRTVESVNCPGCWAKPGSSCIPLRPRSGVIVGATPVYERLPRMYHAERHIRAQRKVGLT